ncbi:MAG: hypothetical protein WC822_03600 [Candidatus Paceibacterota bacterium]|jgi:hypothetical protein
MNKKELKNLYLVKKLSSSEIAKKYNCSETRINYWLAFYKIQKRTISEAIYQKNNPKGDPFLFNNPKNFKKMFLFGLGLGLFWGEGSKRNIHAVRLSNSDPELVKIFINFLIKIYNIDKTKLRFQIQTYDDLNLNELRTFWMKYLSVKNTQFFKTTILKRRGNGTYIKKMKYGVIIINFGNMKLRNLICSQIANIKNL